MFYISGYGVEYGRQDQPVTESQQADKPGIKKKLNYEVIFK